MKPTCFSNIKKNHQNVGSSAEAGQAIMPLKLNYYMMKIRIILSLIFLPWIVLNLTIK